MPIITVNMLEGRTIEKKRELVAKLTNLVCDTLDNKPENVRIILNEIKLEDYSVAGVLKCDVRK